MEAVLVQYPANLLLTLAARVRLEHRKRNLFVVDFARSAIEPLWGNPILGAPNDM